MKTCNTCKIEKPLIEFNKDKYKKDGYQYKCRECYRQYNKQHHIDNDKHYKQYILDNAERLREYKKEYMEQYRIDNADKLIQYGKEYFQTPQGKLVRNTHNHKRRALLRNNTPVGKHFTTADIILKLKLQKGKCVYCNTSIKNGYDIDHIIPVSKGGSNESSNIQLLCEKCNGRSGKWNKLSHEFAQKHGKLF